MADWRARLEARRRTLDRKAARAAVMVETFTAEAIRAAEELPPGGRGSGRTRWPARLAPLMTGTARGRWYCVHTARNVTTATSTAHLLRRGGLRVPRGVWEFTTRGVEVWARYAGEVEEVGEAARALIARDGARAGEEAGE